MTRNLWTVLMIGALPFLSGCASPPAVDSLYGNWVLVAGSDSTGELDASVAVVTLVLEDKSAGGTVCNSYGGEFSGATDALTIGPLAATEMYCTEPEGIMDLESRYLGSLGSVTSGAISDGVLVLTGPGISLEFEPAG